VTTADGVKLKVGVTLEVGRLGGGSTRPRPRTGPVMRPLPVPRPMDTLPRLPPDEGMRPPPRDMLPHLPMDPPTPPPDPD